MLNCMATYRRADKKPSDNILKVAGVTDNLSLNGGAMANVAKQLDSISAMMKPFTEGLDLGLSAFDAVASATAIIDDIVPANFGKKLPLRRVTDADHRANSAKIPPCGSR